MILDDAVLTDDKSMVLIEYTSGGIQTGRDWVATGKVLDGVAQGKWRIVKRPKSYPDKMMRPEAQDIRGQTLKREDFFPAETYETKGVKKKRIAWIQDSVIRGGAEISNELVVRIGRECGFDIRVATQSAPVQTIEGLMAQCDLIVLNNIWAFSGEQMGAIERAIFGQGRPYVKYEHDHRELARPEFSKKLFGNSKFGTFLSPLHLENHRKALGINGICLPLAIDTEFFKPVEGIERKIGTALICNLRNFKSWTKLQAYVDGHPEISFTVMANEHPKVTGTNVAARPMVPYEEMPRLYSEFEYLVHIMDGWGAGERVVFEAALCGCKCVTNERVGHSSWQKDLADVEGLRKWLLKAPYDFWGNIDRVISGKFVPEFQESTGDG